MPKDAAKQLDISQWTRLLTPEGQAEVVAFVRDFRERRGADWIPAIKADYPTLSWLVEIVATKTADEAVDEIAGQFPLFPVRFLAGSQIKELHGRLRAEIDKPR